MMTNVLIVEPDKNMKTSIISRCEVVENYTVCLKY